MPISDAARKRIDRARRNLHKFPQGYTERLVRCEVCGVRAIVRSVPGWHTVVEHEHHGPWHVAGFREVAQFKRVR